MRIFIGFDPSESVAFHVLCHSIWQNASQPVHITPVNLRHLKRCYWRQPHPLQSTEFSISRFLVPYLCDFRGTALFMDCDMMVRGDIFDVFSLFDPFYAVQCTQHSVEHKEGTKMLGQTQTMYPKKNWSSFMLFNCDRCKILSPDFVNTVEPLDLHRFEWCKDEHVGEIPLEWNHLVGVEPHNDKAKNVHWTLGGPWWADYHDVPFAHEWYGMRNSMLRSYR